MITMASVGLSTKVWTKILTSKTKTKKNDVKALYQWVVNANAGDRLLFTAGLDRRKNLDILVKNLIDNNASLNLTFSMYNNMRLTPL